MSDPANKAPSSPLSLRRALPASPPQPRVCLAQRRHSASGQGNSLCGGALFSVPPPPRDGSVLDPIWPGPDLLLPALRPGSIPLPGRGAENRRSGFSRSEGGAFRPGSRSRRVLSLLLVPRAGQRGGWTDRQQMAKPRGNGAMATTEALERTQTSSGSGLGRFLLTGMAPGTQGPHPGHRDGTRDTGMALSLSDNDQRGPTRAGMHKAGTRLGPGSLTPCPRSLVAGRGLGTG